jgi:hypothetical protein
LTRVNVADTEAIDKLVAALARAQEFIVNPTVTPGYIVF